MLEKTLESPLDCKEIQPVHSEDQPWDLYGRNDAKAEAPILWPPQVKSWLIGKDSDAGRDWGLEEKETTEDEMAGWHHWLDEHEFEQALGVGVGHVAVHGVTNCRTPLSDWTELTIIERKKYFLVFKNLWGSLMRRGLTSAALDNEQLTQWRIIL